MEFMKPLRRKLPTEREDLQQRFKKPFPYFVILKTKLPKNECNGTLGNKHVIRVEEAKGRSTMPFVCLKFNANL